MGRPVGGALTLYPSVSMAPNRKSSSTFHLQQDDVFLPLLHQEEGWFFSTTIQSMKDFHSSANEKPLHFKLPVFSTVLFVYNSPSEFPLTSLKELSSPLFPAPVHGLPLYCMSLNLCCSWINPLCWRNTGYLSEANSTIPGLPSPGTVIKWWRMVNFPRVQFGCSRR